jgi:putative effector of murein hydrolase
LSEKKYTLEMIGEFLREAGTLVIVFVPLYELFEPVRHSWYIVVSIISIGMGLVLGGIEVERRRK